MRTDGGAQTRRVLQRLVLVAVPVLAQSISFATPEAIADPRATRLTCTVRVMRGTEPLAGVGVVILTEGEGGRRPDSVTDSTGRATVRVFPGTKYLPYVSRDFRSHPSPAPRDGLNACSSVRQKGFFNAALTAIPDERVPDFCRREGVEEVIELPDTLVRVRVRDAESGALVPYAFVGLRNVEVHLEGQPPPDRGIVAVKASTGELGELELPGLPAGRIEIQARDTDPPHIAGQSRVRESKARTIMLREGDSVLVELAVEEVEPRTLPYDQMDSPQ